VATDSTHRLPFDPSPVTSIAGSEVRALSAPAFAVAERIRSLGRFILCCSCDVVHRLLQRQTASKSMYIVDWGQGR
jgi:hypothetical protein